MRKDKPKQIKPKEKYKISNWSEYNKSLKKRGSLSIWLAEGIDKNWLYTGLQKPGGKKIYGQVAIEFCLTIRSLFRLPYRQTEGMVSSLMTLSGLSLPVPSYTQFNRRTKHISVNLKDSNEDIHIAVDSTGLKVYGEGEWKVRKYGWCKHRTWRKMHLAVNVDTLVIEAVSITGNNTDDASQVQPLLDEISSKVISFRGDGGYDKKKARIALEKLRVKQIIPPQENAVKKEESEPYAFERNAAIGRIKETSRATWKKEIGYHKRSLAEVSMYRYKTIFSGTLQSRKIEYEKKEVAFKCKLLNQMLFLGRAKSYKVT
jgi:IS5 family transposase